MGFTKGLAKGFAIGISRRCIKIEVHVFCSRSKTHKKYSYQCDQLVMLECLAADFTFKALYAKKFSADASLPVVHYTGLQTYNKHARCAVAGARGL